MATIADEMVDAERWRRSAPATTSAAPMQSTAVTMTASSPVSWNVPSQRPVASSACTPTQSVNSVAASSLPMVMRNAPMLTRRGSAAPSGDERVATYKCPIAPIGRALVIAGDAADARELIEIFEGAVDC
jgi:hypothetical protein